MLKEKKSATQFCLRIISNGFSAAESREVSLNGNVYDIYVDRNSIDKSDILNINKYLMTNLIKQVFIVLSSFSSSWARVAKFSDRTWNDEAYMVRPTLFDLNLLELKYYLFMISLDNCNGSCNVWSLKVCARKETKDINLKVFDMIKNKNEAKTMAKQISCDSNCKFKCTTCISNQKWSKENMSKNLENWAFCKNIKNYY